MKIVKLQAENIKKLVAVEIEPDGNIVKITGANGAGKTSVLDSIFWGLAGASNIQDQPIRKGAKSATITLDLGKIIVTRRFKPKADGGHTSSITVMSADGAKFTSPQKMLDELLGKLTFDPTAFSRMSAKDQFDALKKFVPDIDFEAHEGQRKAAFDRRTELNRKVKELRAVVSTKPDGDAPQRIDEDDLIGKMENAADHNSNINSEEMRREDIRVSADTLETQISDLQSILDGNRKEIKAFKPLDKLIDISAVREELDSAKEINRAVDAIEDRVKLENQAQEFEDAAHAEGDNITALDKYKRTAVANAKLPVEGITFGEDHVRLAGVPFDQASSAEQLRASLAIAMAMNPELKVIMVRDGSLLDQRSMEIVAKVAKDQDFQVWIEAVDESGKVGFIMEDGKVRKAEPAVA